MNRAIAILAAVSVLWHTMAGCCAHHGHSAEVGSSAAVEAACEHGHACDSERPSQSPPNDCGEATCAFVTPDAPLSIEFDAPAGAFLSAGILEEQSGLPLIGWLGLAATAPIAPASIARHLALGVLLL